MADDALLTLTADIVAAHVANNQVTTHAVPELIAAVHGALSSLGKPAEESAALTPAVSIRSSVKPDYIVCLEDGAKVKVLKRYLKTHFDMTPEQYRVKWGLPGDYPMVAPSYTQKRSALAKSFGLGGKSKQVVEDDAAPVAKVAKSASKTLGMVAAKAAAAAHLGTSTEVDTETGSAPEANEAEA
ncbi:MucR family transcriptional regulator [Sphingomonas sp. AP4-R1]|uniref:MucR family transcriptional regulator n=1 Tax=Sphingomonas sp. AP4-R1 TaxID=2735134 RepID=UPI0020A32671|nr:MucR family transcriptional regulator [Sphingomonas sp. AP4-R1]